MLGIILLVLATAGIIKAVTSGDEDSSSSEHESYESIRVYPSERKAVRYSDGEEEEYDY